MRACADDFSDLAEGTASNPALTFRDAALMKRWRFRPQVDEPLAFTAHAGMTAPGSGPVTALFATMRTTGYRSPRLSGRTLFGRPRTCDCVKQEFTALVIGFDPSKCTAFARVLVLSIAPGPFL